MTLASCWTAASAYGGQKLVSNGGFEKDFAGWTRWGTNADRITLDKADAHSGTNAARIQYGHNALYFASPLTSGAAYELRLFYRLDGENPSGQVALGYVKKGGALNSAGREVLEFDPVPGKAGGEWIEFRRVFLPSRLADTCQFAFSAHNGSTLWIDDVSLQEVPRPAGMAEPPDPWEGLKHATAKPLFKELLSDTPGKYTVTSWAHDLQRKSKTGFKDDAMKDDAKWLEEVQVIFKDAGEAGMGFMALPDKLDGSEPWRTVEFFREQNRRYGVRYDVWGEGSGSISAAVRNGAEVLNPSGVALGRKQSVSWVDPKYVETQEKILIKLAERLKGEPFVGIFYGKDEPTVHLPEGPMSRWGEYGRTMAREVREQYGYGRFEAPLPRDKSFDNDPDKPLRWIAYNRWANDKFHESRCRLRQAVHAIDPGILYSAANYWFMSGFGPYDFSRMAACSDVIDIDPYASSAEKRRGRGVYQHGFGAKFVSDLSGKPVRIIAQAFDYAGYDMTSENLREWLSQSMRCGASSIQYYTMDSPRWTHRDRWNMMLHLSGVITRMNRVDLPKDPDTAILYALYTHMSHGPSTGGDQVYAAHVLVGELAGSWFNFVSDTQLERGEKKLDGYKVVYLPLVKYMTPEATKAIEEYVRAGGTLVCGDAEAFASDPAGNDTRAARERILGIQAVGPKKADRIVLKSAAWGVSAGMELKLFEGAAVCEITLADKAGEILGTYPDGLPAVVQHGLGKGRVITFAANPFAPQVAVDASAWPAAFKGLQQSLGCKVDRPIWRFALPAPR